MKEIHELNKSIDLADNHRLEHRFLQFEKLIEELKKRKLSDAIVSTVNSHIDKLNSISNGGKELKSQLRKSQLQILKMLEKELHLVVRNHYRNRYLGI